MRAAMIWMLGASLSLAACTREEVLTPSEEAAEKVARVTNWRHIATDADQQRIRNWYKNWQEALAEARSKGFGPQIDAHNALLIPAGGLANPDIPAGDYRCRTIKLGTQARSTLAYVEYDWERCRIDGSTDGKIFAGLSGTQRPSGRIFGDGFTREIFLGTLALSDEQNSIPYGSDRMRDMAGFIERIGDQRWRLVLPSPAYESLIDVMEIVPN